MRQDEREIHISGICDWKLKAEGSSSRHQIRKSARLEKIREQNNSGRVDTRPQVNDQEGDQLLNNIQDNQLVNQTDDVAANHINLVLSLEVHEEEEEENRAKEEKNEQQQVETVGTALGGEAEKIEREETKEAEQNVEGRLVGDVGGASDNIATESVEQLDADFPNNIVSRLEPVSPLEFNKSGPLLLHMIPGHWRSGPYILDDCEESPEMINRSDSNDTDETEHFNKMKNLPAIEETLCANEMNSMHVFDVDLKESGVEREKRAHRITRTRTDEELDQAIAKYEFENEDEAADFMAGLRKNHMHNAAKIVKFTLETESQRDEHNNRDFNPASLHNTPPTDTRPEGDQQDQIMSSTSSKRRNTNNSRCASLLLMSDPSTTKNTTNLDSDDEDEMSSNGESELSKRPRTPRGRYSPDAQRKTNSRLTMSALSIDTYRNADLNADGSGPSSSSAVSCALSTPDPDRLSISHKKKSQCPLPNRSKKRRSPSIQLSQEEQTELDSDDEQEQYEIDNLPIVIDDPTYKLMKSHKDRFKEIKRIVTGEYEFSHSELCELFKTSKGDQARLPESIHFGKHVMKTWYGSPFPAEFVHVRLLFICEYCFFYSRSDSIMQNHAKKCNQRAPPGVEIYRKDDISVFEVDGRIQKSYCQTLCLVSRMFLESKTVFYDTEPFFFYVVTINDEIGCHFAGYFSKEKYEPDVNNLSCIMTLPCHQERGIGRFLIDISYALSRKEGWNGGPEQPLSDLGKKAYGGYWRTTIACSLGKFKDDIEYGDGIGIGDIANDTGINCHDILSVVCSLGWAKLINPDSGKVCSLEWDVDWDVVHEIEQQKINGNAMKLQFDERFLDWSPRRMKPSMDGFHELTKEEIEEDEQKKKNLQKTPIHESMETATPTSSSMPVGSVKKELRSRGHNRNVGRNLKLEMTRKVKVPEVREITDDETKDEEKKRPHKKRKSFSRCADEVPARNTNREETPEDDEKPGPSSSKPTGRRHRSSRESLEVTASASDQKAPSSGKGRYRKRSGGEKFDDSDDPTDHPVSSDDDDRPFGQMGHKGKNGNVQKGKKISKKRKSVSGKKFPPNFGVREEKLNEEKTEEECNTKERPSEESNELETKVKDLKTEDPVQECNGERSDTGMTVASEAEDNHDELHANPTDEEYTKNYDIGTPESYHSFSSPTTPPPDMEQQDLVQEDCAFEENDAAPPLLVSEVTELTVSEPTEALNEGPSTAQPLAPNSADNDGYSTGEDEAPPMLSPIYVTEENENVMAPESSTVGAPLVQQQQPPPPIQQQLSHNGMMIDEPQTYHNPMSAGPSSSMHMTPQMMPSSQQNMMASTPQQQHYSQPNSHQQATPGSGGIPSCGPVYNHSTPEQQNQQFMSPQMAGMPASVSSVHSVHNNNSMEMVGGPASLQHTPQQPYDIGHSLGQMPSDNGVMVNNAPSIDQQNQLIMQQQRHGFNSPPMPAMVPQPQQPQQQQQPLPQQMPQQQQQQQQVPQPPQVAPVVPAPATNGRRRSESAAGVRKQRQRSATTVAPANQALVQAQMHYPVHMVQQMPMPGYFPYGPYGYPQMDNGYFQFNPYYPQMVPAIPDPNYQQRWQQMTAFQGQIQEGNGAAAAGAPTYPFPPGTGPMQFYQNQTR